MLWYGVLVFCCQLCLSSWPSCMKISSNSWVLYRHPFVGNRRHWNCQSYPWFNWSVRLQQMIVPPSVWSWLAMLMQGTSWHVWKNIWSEFRGSWVGKPEVTPKRFTFWTAFWVWMRLVFLLMSQCESPRFIHISGKYIAGVFQHVLWYSTDV